MVNECEVVKYLNLDMQKFNDCYIREALKEILAKIFPINITHSCLKISLTSADWTYNDIENNNKLGK